MLDALDGATTVSEDVLDFLRAAKPEWKVKELTAAAEKLAKAGYGELLKLRDALKTGRGAREVNQKIVAQGGKQFTYLTISALRRQVGVLADGTPLAQQTPPSQTDRDEELPSDVPVSATTQAGDAAPQDPTGEEDGADSAKGDTPTADFGIHGELAEQEDHGNVPAASMIEGHTEDIAMASNGAFSAHPCGGDRGGAAAQEGSATDSADLAGQCMEEVHRVEDTTAKTLEFAPAAAAAKPTSKEGMLALLRECGLEASEDCQAKELRMMLEEVRRCQSDAPAPLDASANQAPSPVPAVSPPLIAVAADSTGRAAAGYSSFAPSPGVCSATVSLSGLFLTPYEELLEQCCARDLALPLGPTPATQGALALLLRAEWRREQLERMLLTTAAPPTAP